MSIRGVNVGGSLFTVSDSTNVAPMELTGTATREYAKNRLLILSNGLLYKTNTVINNGDSIVAGSNVSPTSLDEELAILGLTSNLIAPKEDGANSSDDYSVGDQIARSGLLYKVTATIEQGDTFVVGNNIELAGTVTEQINALKNASDNIVATMTENGAHNLLNHIATTQVIDGVTFTVNADKSITVNGTNNTDNDATFALESRLPSYPNQVSKLYSNGDYILDGCPNGGSVETFSMYVASTKNNSYYEYGIDTGNGLAFTINGDDYNADSAYLGIGITIGAHVTINNLTFYPMIRLATDTDPTYKPYAMTNRELTEYSLKKYWQRVYIPNTHAVYSNTYLEFNKRGHVVEACLNTNLKKPTSGLTTLTLGNVDAELKPLIKVDAAFSELSADTSSHFIRIVIDTNGTITLYMYGESTANAINCPVTFTYLTDN